MDDKRSYAEVLKEANKQLDGMTGEGSPHVRVADDLLAGTGKKKEDNQKKVKTYSLFLT